MGGQNKNMKRTSLTHTKKSEVKSVSNLDVWLSWKSFLKLSAVCALCRKLLHSDKLLKHLHLFFSTCSLSFSFSLSKYKLFGREINAHPPFLWNLHARTKKSQRNFFQQGKRSRRKWRKKTHTPPENLATPPNLNCHHRQHPSFLSRPMILNGGCCAWRELHILALHGHHRGGGQQHFFPLGRHLVHPGQQIEQQQQPRKKGNQLSFWHNIKSLPPPLSTPSK